MIVCVEYLLSMYSFFLILIQFIGAVTWEIAITICMLTLFFALWSFISVIYYVHVAKAISKVNEEINESKRREYARKMLISSTVTSVLQHNDDGGSDLLSDQNCKDNVNMIANEDDDVDNTTDPENKIHEDLYLVDPPYSLTLVVVIAINAVAQIMLQAIIFSTLQLDIRSAVEALTLTFLISFSVFLGSIFWCRSSFDVLLL